MISQRSRSSSHDHLFVYGTLRSGFDNQAARLLHGSADYLGEGRVSGQLFKIADYPGLITGDDSEGAWVQGEVYRLRTPELTYQALDQYEGKEYRRAVLPVQLGSEEWLEASVYVYVFDVSGKERIGSGDYLVR